MNNFFLGNILILLPACNNTPAETRNTDNSRKTELHLLNSLGVITFSGPARYDTSFSWVHYSDCNTCHRIKYRFQLKQDPVLKESGFYWDRPGDSVDRLTISYQQYYRFRNTDATNDMVPHDLFKSNLAAERINMQVISDTIYKINDRYFSIFEMQDSGLVSKKEVLAITTINGHLINFSCELMSVKHDSLSINFYSNSLHLINSIVIRSYK